MSKGQPDWRKAVDIAGQTLDKVSVDIIAQTLAKMAVDIAAVSVGNLAIDVVAQTIANLAININAQALSRVVQRPSYGGANIVRSTAYPGANSRSLIFSITGTGITYGGFFWAYASVSHALDYIDFEIDGVNHQGCTFSILNSAGVVNPLGTLAYLLKYDETQFYYVIGFPSGITFESSLKCYYTNQYSTTPTLFYYFTYAIAP